MSTDIESVKTALEGLRDVASEQAKSDQPDLRAVAEEWNKFQDAWVGWRVEELRKEENPDEQLDIAQDDTDKAEPESRVVEADEKVVAEPAKVDEKVPAEEPTPATVSRKSK